ncbi:MAG: 5-formyltetrahydrofolate cyclo-ligase [Casimicrobiaceae bacterium]
MTGVEPEVHRPALHEAKLALRNRIVAARDALDAATRASAAAAIAARILALPSYQSAQTVLLTLAFRSEWNTRPLLDHALATGKTVLLPRVDVAARMLVLHRVRDLDTDVGPGYQAIPEPRPGCAAVAPGEVDWVLVPGVAFDRNGRRLGYGGGFYDRLLPLVPARAARVAGAYGLQVVEEVPAAPHDVAIDALVTQHETFHVSRR